MGLSVSEEVGGRRPCEEAARAVSRHCVGEKVVFGKILHLNMHAILFRYRIKYEVSPFFKIVYSSVDRSYRIGLCQNRFFDSRGRKVTFHEYYQ